jgi:hypothetical protein
MFNFMGADEVSGKIRANRRFKFQKRRQLFIRPDYETLSVAAMSVNNPDRSPTRI